MKMKILISAIIVMANINASADAAKSCDTYQYKIQRLQELNAKGGKAKQQLSRRKKINQYEDAFYKCRNTQKILVTDGRKKNSPRAHREKLRTSNNPNPELQQLIKTCNYWIEQNNNYPSWDNGNFRDTACRAANEADQARDIVRRPSRTRKLSDCIKPNNLIDHEVDECIQGMRAAHWKKHTEKKE